MKLRLSPLTVLSLLAGALPAFGLGFRVPDQNPSATARGDAFAATADNPSAVYYNPAGITQLDGTNVLLGTYGIMFNTRISLDLPHAKDFDNKYDPQAAPQVFATVKLPNTPVSLGLGIYSPFGFKNRYADDVPFRTLAKEGRVEYLSYNPVIAVQVSRTFSAALGLSVNHATTELVQGVFARHDEFRFQGSGTAFGLTAGLMWKPAPMHSFGATYFSPTSIDFDGYTHLRHDDIIVPVQVAPGLTVPVNVSPKVDHTEEAHARINFPQHIIAGYSFRPTPDWNFEADLDWTDWDKFDVVTLHQTKAANISIPFNWRSSFLYEFGVTRQFGNFHASLGYVYSEASVPNEAFNPIVPDGDRHIFSIGVGQKFNDHLSLDVAYQYTYGPSRTISQGSLADGSYRFEAHALSLALGYHF